jgi:PAS domain S-box-containing protein
LYDILPPDLAASRKARIEQVVRSGNPVRFEDERAGRAFDNSLYPVLDAQGEVAAIVVYARDITGRRRVEEALRESEVRFRSIVEQSRDAITLFDEQGKIAEWNRATEQLTGVGRAEAIGQYAWDVQFQALPELERSPERYASIKAALQQFFETGQGPWLGQLQEANIGHVDGTRRVIQQSSFAIETAQGFMLGAISRDITERKQAEMALDRRVEELAALNQIAKTVSTVADLPAVLGQVSQVAATLLDACCACIVLPTAGENGTMFLHGFHRETGILEPSLLDPALADFSLYRRVLSQPEPEPLAVSASDWQSESLADFPLLRQALSQAEPQAGSASDKLSQLLPPMVREVLTPESLQSLMLVPLVVRGVATGFMVVATDQASRSYTADDVSLAETIAGDIAAAVENTRLLEQAQAVAVAEERSRLARDLHDAVTQSLFLASSIAEALPRVWERKPDEARRGLAELRWLTQGALAEMRTLLLELRPATLTEQPLGILLRQLADAMMSRTRTPVATTIAGDCRLPGEVQIALYRIAQEALNNIVKHAHAGQITVGLHNEPERVVLCIHDDGDGFDADVVEPSHLGVGIMRERAQAIAAEFTLDSRPGQGTEITVVWMEDEGRRTNGG